MDKPNYLGFAILELSILQMYETLYDKLQPYLGDENVQLYFIDTDAFDLSLNTKDIIRYLKNLEDLFDFGNIVENHELYSNKNKKVIGQFEIETPKNIWIDDFVCLRSKICSFKCGHDIQNKLKGISKSQTKLFKFEDYKKCLDGEEYQRECNKYILPSINHEMYLQEVKKSTLSVFDDERFYEKTIKSKPWE